MRCRLVIKRHRSFLHDHTNERILTDVDCCISAVYREPYEGTGQIEGVQLRRTVPIETSRRGLITSRLYHKMVFSTRVKGLIGSWLEERRVFKRSCTGTAALPGSYLRSKRYHTSSPISFGGKHLTMYDEIRLTTASSSFLLLNASNSERFMKVTRDFGNDINDS